MNYLFDTNIVVAYIRQSKLSKIIDERFTPLAFGNSPIISVVSVGEIKSLAIQFKWGNNKLMTVESMLNEFLVADINTKSIVENMQNWMLLAKTNFQEVH